jgi:predicted nucleic acid-binding protein
MYLLDTNVVSEMRKARKADSNVMARLSAQPAHAFFISSMTLLELEIGTLLVERRDPRQGARLRAWLDTVVVPHFSGRTLGVDDRVARQAAQMHVPDPAPELDALIAATALVNGLILITRSEKDFSRSGVRVINPWKP